jgi:hypothetical protein
MAFVIPDISEFQSTAIDLTYTRDAVIFRGSFGASYPDHKFLANAGAAAVLWSRGRLSGGAVIYTVFTATESVQSQYNELWNLIGPKVPDWLTGIMIDVEEWAGQPYEIRGDHSAAINRLYGMHVAKMGSSKAVKAYHNVGDGRAVYPRRDARCDVVVAGYVGQNPMPQVVPGAVGWQYTNGVMNYTTYPKASTPMGACDHNIFPTVRNGAQFRALWGRPAQGAAAPAVKPPVAKPKPVVAPKPAPAPKPKPAGPSAKEIAVSPDGTSHLIIANDGTLTVRKSGRHLYTIPRGK